MKNSTRFAAGRRLDIICLGRLGADFYAQQIGARLEDVASFAKYLGGSSANTAFGCARLGLKAAMVSRVGDDAMGRFLVETLVKEGCDISHVGVDPQRLTAGVVLGIKDRDTFPLIFLRENCADMAIPETEVAAEFIAESRALLITGTHFSTAHVHRVSTLALERARAHDVRTVLDIDYRPVLWGLTRRGDGETRFIASDTVTAHLQGILPLFDLVIGTQEEFAIAGGSTEIMTALAAVRKVTKATLVVKRGPMGCAVIDGPIPASLDAAFNGRGVTVEVLNVLGAGDAFSAGFMSGWVRGEDYDACSRYANACGALVVSRHGCAPAMPTRVELDYYLANAHRIPRPDRDAELTRLHRVSAPRTPRDELFIFAFDHREPFFELARETGAAEGRIPALKKLLVRAVGETESARGLQGRVGLLCDDRYGQDALNAATGRGWWVGRPVELPGSNPLVFEHGRSVGTTLIAWPVEQVVKCLVAFHPDDEIENRLENEAQLRTLYDAVQVSGHELLIEIVPPKHLPDGPGILLRAMQRLYNLGIYPEWWKLPPPAAGEWPAIDALIAARDPYCRGVVLLGLNASIEQLAGGFADARRSRSCRGFAVGRTIFHEPARAWLAAQGGAAGGNDAIDAGLIAAVRRNYETLIDAWLAARPAGAAKGGD
ncbi:MAG: 5-dehydro-2-deoxygluconokinase [Betaproteobacteria bacterium]|nr:5-dehydro-2-deoxygluconokinase [Betaproteobacteria bacterium]